MTVLGLESSCDDSAAAIVRLHGDGRAEVLAERLTVKANLINLTNKFYADSLYANGHYIPGFGRTVYITGTLKF